MGIAGKTYPIAEPDMIDFIQTKAKTLVDSGKWDKIKQETIDRTKNKIDNPPAVVGITHTKTPLTTYYDPMFKVESDVTDAQGKLIAKAGYYNPLTFKPFPEELIFIDGEDEDQVNWAVNQFRSNTKKTKIILTSGSFMKLDKSYKIWFYYDQGGMYTKKLNIHHVPATVNQEGKQLRVDEVVINVAK